MVVVTLGDSPFQCVEGCFETEMLAGWCFIGCKPYQMFLTVVSRSVGPLPPSWGAMNNLSEVSLRSNRLSGAHPELFVWDR
jgi:hypothetical protein